MQDEVRIEKENKVNEEELDDKPKSEAKKIAVIIVAVIAVLAISLGSFSSLYQNDDQITGGATSVDELHRRNLAGDLDNDNGYVYEGFSVVKYDGLWWVQVQKQSRLIKIPLHFGPRDVEFIKIKGQLGPEFNQKQEILIAIDPTVADKFYTLAASELGINVVQGINRMPIAACTKEDDICKERPIASCENSGEHAVIELALANKPSVTLSGKCIKIEGKEYNLLRAVDRLLLNWYGVMK